MNDEQKELLARLWAQCARAEEIAAALGVGRTKVYALVAQLGLPPRNMPRKGSSKPRRRFTVGETVTIRKYWGRRSPAAIAKAIGTTAESVRGWAWSNGLPSLNSRNQWTYRDRAGEVRDAVFAALAAGQSTREIRARLHVGTRLVTRLRAEWRAQRGEAA